MQKNVFVSLKHPVIKLKYTCLIISSSVNAEQLCNILELSNAMGQINAFFLILLYTERDCEEGFFCCKKLGNVPR